MRTELTTSLEKRAALEAIRMQFEGSDSATQRKRLMESFQCGWAVSTFEAMRYLDVYFPPARIKELRNLGVQIKTFWVDTFTESGDRHLVGLYMLEEMQRNSAQELQSQTRLA